MCCVKRRMRAFMSQLLLQEAVLCRVLCMLRVNENVVVSASQQFVALVDPDRLKLNPKHGGQPADKPPVVLCFCHGRRGTAKFRVDLNLGTQAVVKRCIEQIGIDGHESIDTPVKHGAHATSGSCHALKRRRV